MAISRRRRALFVQCRGGHRARCRWLGPGHAGSRGLPIGGLRRCWLDPMEAPGPTQPSVHSQLIKRRPRSPERWSSYGWGPACRTSRREPSAPRRGPGCRNVERAQVGHWGPSPSDSSSARRSRTSRSRSVFEVLIDRPSIDIVVLIPGHRIDCRTRVLRANPEEADTTSTRPLSAPFSSISWCGSSKIQC